MKPPKTLMHEFVEFIPDAIEEGKIYVSIEYATAVHKCACGCGKEVVTPLSPTDWKLIFDGKTVSLDPSIGNWSFECQSHYWVTNGMVRWAPKWTPEQIASGRTRSRRHRARARDDDALAAAEALPTGQAPPAEPSRVSRWLKRLFSR